MRYLPIIPVFLCGLLFGASGMKQNIADKVIVLNIYENGTITDGLDTIASEDLALYIRERLFKNYTGTGRMYDKIKIKTPNDKVPAAVMETVLKEIKAGQKAALAELCLHNYKKYFDDLGTNQQKKIKKQFPVLFQDSYT